MKIDRDNFRHLTGFGRDMANYVESVLSSMGSTVFAEGNLQIFRCKDSFSHRFVQWEDQGQSFPFRTDGEMRTILSILVWFEGYRECTAVPLDMIFPHSPIAYHVYQHCFSDDTDKLEGSTYTGVTKRGWRARWQQHLSAARSGSHYRFHKAIREWYGTKTMMHTISAVADSEQKAMEIEEHLIERESLYPLGLNMIPGGNAGLAYLRRIGALGKHERVSVDDRQQVINRFFERASRKGLPNPLAAANWLSSDYAEKVICAGEDRLKPQQIRDARFFASLGRDADDIASQIGARNVAQVERLLSGQTYSRIA